MLTFRNIGNWPVGSISVSWARNTRAIIPAVEHHIEQLWSKSSARPGVQLFDGPMCRLESARADGDFLHLALSRTSYRIFMGTNMNPPTVADERTDVLANPVGVSPALITSDGYFMLGRRNASVAYYPNRLHPFAGALEPRDDLDVFQDVLRELNEELSLTPDQVKDLRCIGLVEDNSLRQPELIFSARTLRTRAQIESQVDRAEHAGAWATAATAREISAALAKPHPFTPVAIAAMLLFGRLEFGENFFMEWKDL